MDGVNDVDIRLTELLAMAEGNLVFAKASAARAREVIHGVMAALSTPRPMVTIWGDIVCARWSESDCAVDVEFPACSDMEAYRVTRCHPITIDSEIRTASSSQLVDFIVSELRGRGSGERSAS